MYMFIVCIVDLLFGDFFLPFSSEHMHCSLSFWESLYIGFQGKQILEGEMEDEGNSHACCTERRLGEVKLTTDMRG
jgi:hypothetical protein